jgi:uncharacterized protein YjbI with pentapeptide repeats
VPYAEEDEVRFFGRRDEIDQLLTMVESHTLTILTAWSGVGKTSLLQAALLPALRRARLQDRSRLGFTLLLRRWSHRGQRSPGGALLDAVSEALLEVPSRPVLRDDKAALADVARMTAVPLPPLPGDGGLRLDECQLVVEYLSELARVAQRLVLIVDQAEELLGSGVGPPDADREDELLAILGLLHRDAPQVNVLVALREEYYGRLRRLSEYVEAIDKRTFRLDPLPRERAEEVIRDSVQKVRSVELRSTEIQQILDWLSGGGGQATQALTGRPVDLLRMQALLVDLLDYARQRAGADGSDAERAGTVRLTHALLDQYIGGRRPAKLAAEALERHIEKVVGSVVVPGGGPAAPKVARRIVARMGDWLSSPGGFKRPSEECELLYNVLRPETELLLEAVPPGPGAAERHSVDGEESSGEQVRAVFAEWKKKSDYTGAAAERLKFVTDDPVDPTSWRSGEARTWDPQKTLRELARAGFAALEHLVARSVLKRSVVAVGAAREQKVIYELVHDGFGPALVEWGEKERRSIRDAMAALVSQRGQTFKWAEATSDIQDVSWLGCNIIDTDFTDASFRRCALRGTIFINCRFVRCEFEDCDLDGAVFVGARSTIHSLRWRGGTARSALFRGIRFQDVDVEDVVLEGVTLAGSRVSGELRFERVELPFAQVHGFTRDGSGARVVFVGCDLRNALLRNMDDDFVSVDPSSATLGLIRELPVRTDAGGQTPTLSG